MTQIDTNQGEYFNYDSHCIITHVSGDTTTAIDFHAKEINFDYSVVSNDENTPSQNTVTIYNMTKTAFNTISIGDKVQINTGPANIYGMIVIGYISSIVPQASNQDDAVVITFIEGQSYADIDKLKVTNTVTYGKNDDKEKDVTSNVSFNAGTYASTIISTIASQAGISLAGVNLGNNKCYTNGYSADEKPIDVINAVATDCNSRMYYRPTGLYVDSINAPDPYTAAIVIGTVDYGPIEKDAQLNANSGDNGGNTYTMNGFDDPRLYAGCPVFVKTNSLWGLHRVKQVTHSHTQTTYTMEVEVYA